MRAFIITCIINHALFLCLVSNTRVMPIVLTKEEWARINKWTDSSKEDAEAVRRREYLKYLDESSRSMTKTWPNSVENVNKRNEEIRLARIKTAEEANSKFYKRYVKIKQEEQKHMMYKARETVFKNKDAPKFLYSAFMGTVVQKERQEQIKFNNELKKQADDQKKKDDEEIHRRSKEWHELEEIRKKIKFEVDKQYQQELVEQAKEMAVRNLNQAESEYQKIDLVKAEKQMNEIRQFEEAFKQAEKARILADIQQSRVEAEARRKEREARDMLEEKIQGVLDRARCRVERRRRQTEAKIKNDKLAILEKVTKTLTTRLEGKEAKLEEAFQKAVREQEATAEARRLEDERKKEKIKQERIEIQRQFLENERKRLQDLGTMRQWELTNRFKNMELYEDFLEKQHEEDVNKRLKYREDVTKLWNERADQDKAEVEAMRRFCGEEAERNQREADNRLLTYAAQLIEEAKRHGRPTLPLVKAVDRYCQMYRLYPMPDLPLPLKRVFPQFAPIDRSKPDADYRPPEPPTAEGSTPASAVDPGSRRDGLQSAQSSQPTVEEKKEAEYVRSGPANGLQRQAE